MQKSMPSLSQLPDGIKRKQLVRALTRLGFIIDEKGGDGSHYKAIWPKNNKSLTLQYNFRKDVLYHVLKEIEKISGLTWEDIKKEL